MRNFDVAKAFSLKKKLGVKHLFIERIRDVLVIFSYGSHFPIAVWCSDGSLLFNTSRWSVTTSAHKNLVWRFLDDEQRKKAVLLRCEEIIKVIESESQTLKGLLMEKL